MGRDGIDNGWMQFNNVEVPRTNMLMKWAKLSPEGVYTKPPKAQLAYGALLRGRVGLIMNSAHNLEKALIIGTSYGAHASFLIFSSPTPLTIRPTHLTTHCVAIRYSVIRRQFASTSKGLETQILDYQTHQVRCLSLRPTPNTVRSSLRTI
jgi:acyl-CoA oxidase